MRTMGEHRSFDHIPPIRIINDSEGPGTCFWAAARHPISIEAGSRGPRFSV